MWQKNQLNNWATTFSEYTGCGNNFKEHDISKPIPYRMSYSIWWRFLNNSEFPLYIPHSLTMSQRGKYSKNLYTHILPPWIKNNTQNLTILDNCIKYSYNLWILLRFMGLSALHCFYCPIYVFSEFSYKLSLWSFLQSYTLALIITGYSPPPRCKT